MALADSVLLFSNSGVHFTSSVAIFLVDEKHKAQGSFGGVANGLQRAQGFKGVHHP